MTMKYIFEFIDRHFFMRYIETTPKQQRVLSRYQNTRLIFFSFHCLWYSFDIVFIQISNLNDFDRIIKMQRRRTRYTKLYSKLSF